MPRAEGAPDWIFLFPVEHVLYDLASVMAQSRVGTAAFHRHRGELVFRAADQEVLPGRGERLRPIACGRKVGSR